MSGIPYESFLSSKPFLVIGPGKTQFYAHGPLLAQASPVLQKDVDGGMKETQLQTTEIQDVDGDIDDDTVMRFIEFAYSGDYSVPEPDVVQLENDSEGLQVAFKSSFATETKAKKNKRKSAAAQANADSDHLAPESPIHVEESTPLETISMPPLGPLNHETLSDRQGLWVNFCSGPRSQHRAAWRPRENNDSREDYTRVFLCHAALYKFSDRYQCEKLMAWVLQKLRLTLSRYRFHPQRVTDIVALIRYTYDHTEDFGNGPDGLRALVLAYIVCYFRELVQQPPFYELLEQGGSFPSDLMLEVARLVA